jgi:hypothetical protein
VHSALVHLDNEGRSASHGERLSSVPPPIPNDYAVRSSRNEQLARERFRDLKL